VVARGAEGGEQQTDRRHQPEHRDEQQDRVHDASGREADDALRDAALARGRLGRSRRRSRRRGNGGGGTHLLRSSLNLRTLTIIEGSTRISSRMASAEPSPWLLPPPKD